MAWNSSKDWASGKEWQQGGGTAAWEAAMNGKGAAKSIEQLHGVWNGSKGGSEER